MKNLKITLTALALAFTVIAGAAVPLTAHAATDPLAKQCADFPDAAVCKENASPKVLVQGIVNTLLFILGSVSVIVIIVAGIMYATSAGDSSRVTKAKNTIMYAVIGLVVSLLAYAIVGFVVSRIK